MRWNSLGEFLAMGGYGLYVWMSFGMTALCMAVEAVSVRRRYRTLCRTARPGQSDKERA
jgi:heme exporter protein D